MAHDARPFPSPSKTCSGPCRRSPCAH
jgi:hypothetical protein